MRNACIKSFNKFYDMNFKLKEKQKGRNQDINVNDMGNYREIKKQLVKKEQKLEKANTQTRKLDNTSKDIKEILSNLKPTKLNKHNMVISNEDVQKIKDFWHSIMSHFHKRICYDKDNNYKIASDDLYKSGIFTDDENEIANNIARKITIPEENKQTKNKKRNNDTRF